MTGFFLYDTKSQVKTDILSELFIKNLHLWSDDDQNIWEMRIIFIEEVNAFFIRTKLFAVWGFFRRAIAIPGQGLGHIYSFLSFKHILWNVSITVLFFVKILNQLFKSDVIFRVNFA